MFFKKLITNDGIALCRRNAHIFSSERDCPWYDVCGLTFAKGMFSIKKQKETNKKKDY